MSGEENTGVTISADFASITCALRYLRCRLLALAMKTIPLDADLAPAL